MRAFVVTAPGEAGVEEVPEPVAAAGEVVVDVERVGVCGTDVEFATGTLATPSGWGTSGAARSPRSARGWTPGGAAGGSPATR
jgi:D-arabinose 1-dehydrogenase-like Zn-dependent alcohol dehydrogenase